MLLERCCIMVACGRNRLGSGHLLHQRCNTLGFSLLERCCITVACGRKRVREQTFVASTMQHTTVFVAGEMLHHGGMWEEEVSERMFVASTMQHTGFRGLRDVAGEMLHHGGMWEEEG